MDDTQALPSTLPIQIARCLLLQRKMHHIRKQLKRLKKQQTKLLVRMVQSYTYKYYKRKLTNVVRRCPFNEHEKQIIARTKSCRLDNIDINLDCLEKDWLTDEIINHYLKIHAMRNKHVYLMNTFFYNKLMQGHTYNKDNGTSFLKNITDDHVCILFPLHVNDSHWILVCADMKTATMYVLDSTYIPSETPSCIRYIMRFLDEAVSTCEKWKMHHLKDTVAQQDNSSDCGVYCCMFARVIMESYNISACFPPHDPARYFQFTYHDAYVMRRQIGLELCGAVYGDAQEEIR